MADRFVDNAGSNTSPYDTWAKAATTLATAVTGSAAGDTFYVANTHSESSAGVTINFTGTTASPNRVLCVTPSGVSGNSGLATGAQIATTVNNSITLGYGFAYIYGIKFIAGNSTGSPSININTNTSNSGYLTLENCDLQIGSTGTAARVDFNANSANGTSFTKEVVLINTRFKFADPAQKIGVIGHSWIWRDTASAVDGAGSVPTELFFNNNGTRASMLLSGLDLSALNSSSYSLFNVSRQARTDVVVRDCKLGASVNLTTGTPVSSAGMRIKLHNCDSGDTNYRMQEHAYEGDVTQETTIVRTSGASDGTTALSWKMVSSANPEFHVPLVSPEITFWNDSTGSKTVTVEVVSDNVTFTDAELWLEVEALTTAGFPIAARTSDRAADVLATPANQTSSSVTWTTTGLTTPVKQKLAVTFTANEKGIFRARACMAKASSTVYVDPLLTVS